tara:strand:+ start:954 stop:1847 length:894 start_codon:yes stop_codon:yes gene_type:complete
MRIGLLAEKIGMSRFYDKDMVNHSVTILKVKDCKVVSIKNVEKHGYNSITLSHGSSGKRTNKSFAGFLKKNNLKSYSKCNEFRVSESNNFKVGENLNATCFVVGQFVDVSSNSIGKGFAGGMKRHNFSGNRATHGVSISHRSHGSTGQCQDPGKVFKGKKMAGRLGNKKVTIQNLKVLNIDLANNLLIIKGAVPGHKGSVIRIFDSVKKNQDIKVQNNESKTENIMQQQASNDNVNKKNDQSSETLKQDQDNVSSEMKNNKEDANIQNNQINEKPKDKTEIEEKNNNDQKKPNQEKS